MLFSVRRITEINVKMCKETANNNRLERKINAKRKIAVKHDRFVWPSRYSGSG